MALRMVLGSVRRPADEQQLADFLQFANLRGIAITDTTVAERRGRLLCSMLPVTSPGRTVLLLAAADLPAGADRAAADALVEAVCADCAQRGVQLAQVLIDPADAALRDHYLSHRFRVMAELLYLQVLPPPIEVPPRLPPGFSLTTYAPSLHDRFGNAIAESYHNSLDCPGLNGLRNIDDVIAGHKASGEYQPHLWFLLGESVGGIELTRGVLLLSRIQRADAMELVYLGLTSQARGRGLGDLLMRHALHACAADGRGVLSLAVDAGNAPALKLYYRHGMQRVGSKLALMRELLPPGADRSEVRG